MEAIGLNPIRLDRIGLDPIRVNAIKLGVPGTASGSARPYIDPEVLASLVAVCICDGKSNNDPDRAVIKNLVDPDNPFIISNAAYKLNSGYGKYEEDFTTWTPQSYVADSTYTSNKLHITNIKGGNAILYTKKGANAMKVKITGIQSFNLVYRYIAENDVWEALEVDRDGIYELPASTTTTKTYYTGFTVPYYTGDCDITITQIPSFEGALVTDGKDDLITSTKTVKEMLGGSNEITVVSMVHQIGLSSLTTINNIRSESVAHVVCRNVCSSAGKTGIYGYSRQINTNNPPTLINNILGDKKDYTAEGNSALDPTDKFFVQGYKYSGSISEVSQIAYYWTFIANKVLTTDQINQVISYFNLDKHVKPDIIYDTIRQGITNENHASFNDELVDFSGNGHNMKIYNSAWNKESGINDEGAWQTDGVSDYGNVENLPILKDYTVAIERRWITSPVDKNQCLAFKGHTNDWGAFACEFSNAGQLRSYTFSPNYNILQSYNEKSLVYQSKYSYSGTPIDAKSTIDGSTLRLCLPRGGFPFYANVAIKIFLLFPYSLSEFLLERQLKRYKLGTLYPDMVEFRPVISRNIPYNDIWITQGSTTLYNKSINKTGIYLQEGSTVIVYIQPSGIDEVSKITINGIEYTDLPINPNGFYYAAFPITKSPQKISYAIDEYIRYEDIVQPYPAIINLKQDGKTITWGDKLKVGSDIVFAGSVNLLPELYTVSETRYNGVTLYPNTIIKVEKSMVFDNARTYLKANEPNCILSPNRLRIPNSSYKILGYIPDLTGKGNHGVINNSAYVGMSGANGYVYNWNTWRISKSGITSTITDNSLHITSLKGQYNPNQALFEPNTVANTGDKSNFKVNITGLTSDMKCTFNNAGSIMKELINGVNEISVDLVAGWYGFMITTLDGSVIGDCDITIQQIGQYEGSFCFDGADDHITIPTLAHGSKCMLMKVNWNKDALMLYDQRRDNNPNSFAIYIPYFKDEDSIAYSSRNDGKTYIDGVLNTSVKGSQLKDVTHNITITNSNSNNDNTVSPAIGSNAKYNAFYAQMVLYEFMLLPDVPDEEEIKELNDIVGIENNIEVS